MRGWRVHGGVDHAQRTPGDGRLDHGDRRQAVREVGGRQEAACREAADLPPVRALYGKGFELERVEARRGINSDAGKRGPVGELIIT